MRRTTVYPLSQAFRESGRGRAAAIPIRRAISLRRPFGANNGLVAQSPTTKVATGPGMKSHLEGAHVDPGALIGRTGAISERVSESEILIEPPSK